MKHTFCPACITNCADCGVGTITLGEFYMVKPSVWAQAWNGRRKPWHGKIPGQEILCIGCLEARIDRTLIHCDFTDAPINNPNKSDISDRLRNRLTAVQGTINGLDGLVAWAIEGMIEKLPEHQRAHAREATMATIGPDQSDEGES
jgi:hypothetical protein